MLGKKKKESTCIILFAKEGRSNDDVEVARGAVFQALRPEARFKIGDFVKEKLGGGYRRTTRYTIEGYS